MDSLFKVSSYGSYHKEICAIILCKSMTNPCGFPHSNIVLIVNFLLLQSLLRIMNLRRYHGRVQFVPAPGYEAFGEPLQQNGDRKAVTEISRQDKENGAQVQQGGYQGPSVCPDSLEWRFLDGPFVSVWLNNVPWAGEDIMPAPDAKVVFSSSLFLNIFLLLLLSHFFQLLILVKMHGVSLNLLQFSDGYLDVLIIRDCPKSSMLALMLKMADGSHVKSPYVVYLKVCQLSFKQSWLLVVFSCLVMVNSTLLKRGTLPWILEFVSTMMTNFLCHEDP